jgi:NAD(P)-dependent dehydrogenase (short-subunit alcohol dehydrogenase family)
LGLTEACTLEQAQRIFDTNFFGAVRINRAVRPYIRRRRTGLLVHVSSGAGRVGIPGFGFYSASKFALEAYVLFRKQSLLEERLCEGMPCSRCGW